jgi:hypothetical protein
MLIPARTDTANFNDYRYHKAKERFIRGKLKYGNATISAPFQVWQWFFEMYWHLPRLIRGKYSLAFYYCFFMHR